MSDSGRTERTVKGNNQPSASKSLVNALDANMANYLANNVNTAAQVSISGGDAAGPDAPAGTASCQPMVGATDNFGQVMPTAAANGAPYFRLQAGNMAIVIDPRPGDTGLAVYTKADSSGAAAGQEGASPPASNRPFDPANGFVFGGFKNAAPESYIELNPDSNEINIKSKNACKITIETEGEVTIKGSKIVLDGPIEAKGGIQVSGGSLSTDTATFDTHTHPGDGGGNTGAPNGGS